MWVNFYWFTKRIEASSYQKRFTSFLDRWIKKTNLMKIMKWNRANKVNACWTHVHCCEPIDIKTKWTLKLYGSIVWATDFNWFEFTCKGMCRYFGCMKGNRPKYRQWNDINEDIWSRSVYKVVEMTWTNWLIFELTKKEKKNCFVIPNILTQLPQKENVFF